MATVIRLSRGGAKKRPFYRVVVTDNRAPRDGDFIERLGTFNPLLPKDAQRLTINEDRAKHWLSKGAQPSDRVTKLFAELNLVEKPDYTGKPVKTRKKADKTTRAEKRASDAEAAKDQAKADAQAAKEAAEAPAAEAPAEAAAEEAPAA